MTDSAPTLDEAFLQAMRRLAAGVAVVTTDGPAGKAGLTVSSLTSLTAEPPSVLVCVAKDAAAAPLLLENKRVGISILSVAQSRISNVFAGREPEMEKDRFLVCEWETAAGGQALVKDAPVGLSASVAQVHAYGTHYVVLAAIEDVRLGAPGEGPLIYAGKGYQRLSGPL